jgi:hypothetical protein
MFEVHKSLLYNFTVNRGFLYLLILLLYFN